MKSINGKENSKKNSDVNNISSTSDTKTINDTKEQDIKTFDYSFVPTVARVAIYDSNISAPRIIEIKPDKTAEFIEHLTTEIYTNAQSQGGSIPYTAIREVTENFIHAQFAEIVVSILNNGKTIRFADQGPGISNKEKAQLPGFSSAIEPMKEYIRGVGSGLPIVKEYLNFTKGNITIEDNISAGAVITLNQEAPNNQNFYAQERQGTQQIKNTQEYTNQTLTNNQAFTNNKPLSNNQALNINTFQNNIGANSLSDKEKVFMLYLFKNGPMRVTDLVNLTQSAPSSTHAILKKLENKNLITHDGNKKRLLTDLGISIAENL